MKNFVLTFAILLMGLSSCQKDPIEPNPNPTPNPKNIKILEEKIEPGEKQTLRLSLNIEAGEIFLDSKSEGLDTIRFRLMYQYSPSDTIWITRDSVYVREYNLEGSDELIRDTIRVTIDSTYLEPFTILKDTIYSLTQSTFVLEDSIYAGNYDLSLWGDYVVYKNGEIVKAHYAVDEELGLQRVEIISPESDEDWKFAYSGYYPQMTLGEDRSVTASMQRCMAQIQFVNPSYTVYENAEKANFELRNFSTAYNVQEGAPIIENTLIRLTNIPLNDYELYHRITIFESVHDCEIHSSYTMADNSVHTFPVIYNNEIDPETNHRKFGANFYRNYVIYVGERWYYADIGLIDCLWLMGDETIFNPKPASQVLERDSLALVDFFVSLNGRRWVVPWNLNLPVSNWAGVELRTIDGIQRVVSLDLAVTAGSSRGNNLHGSVPTSVNNLDFLEVLKMQGYFTEFHGFTLPKLKELTVIHNPNVGVSIGGYIGPEFYFGNLTSLQTVLLENLTLTDVNQLTVNPDLEEIEIRNFGRLEEDVFFPDVSLLTNLKKVSISGGVVTVNLSPGFRNITSLESLDLAMEGAENIITPDDICDHLVNLKRLIYFHSPNQLITSKIGQLKNLEYFYTYHNSGTFPEEITHLSNLKGLYVIWGEMEGELPGFLGKLENLEEIYIAAHKFTGTIPDEWSRLTKLRYLSVPQNNLSGPIPIWVASLPSFILYSNRFTGEFPQELKDSPYWESWNAKEWIYPQQDGYGFTNAD